MKTKYEYLKSWVTWSDAGQVEILYRFWGHRPLGEILNAAHLTTAYNFSWKFRPQGIEFL